MFDKLTISVFSHEDKLLYTHELFKGVMIAWTLISLGKYSCLEIRFPIRLSLALMVI